MSPTWYRIAFTEVQLMDWRDACSKINDALRHRTDSYMNWPSDLGAFFTDDWIYPTSGEELAIAIYLSPAAAVMLEDFILEFNGEPCGKPLPFGLGSYGGGDKVWRLLD